MTPLISIVTISKDDPLGLAATLASVSEQDFTDFEHIIVRSGESQQIMLPQGPHIVSVDVPARGISQALNTGVELARGQWIQFLNGGDCYASGQSLGHLAEEIDDKIQIISSFAQVLHRRFTIPRRRLRPERHSFLYISHQASLFRRDLFLKNGSFAPDIRIHMDLEWLTRLPPETPYIFVDKTTVLFDPFGVSATHVVNSSFEEAKILWKVKGCRARAWLVLFFLLPFRVVRREFRRLTKT